ncbi:MAG: 16S rRNA (cytosine(967)-C(5))-methyltransferase RsmB [Ruminococcaceae bacterium]|nr:16S rRNA (cytosine(967)-C(5))-methyltransferase RsmB [Oscillospiraceae bacterium]
MENIRQAAVKILTDCEKKRSYSNLVLKAYKNNGEISDADYRLLCAIVNGTLEKRVTIDFYLEHFIKKGLKRLSATVLNILRIGVFQILYLDKVPDSAACNECVKIAKKMQGNISGFVNGVLRNISRQKDSLPLPDKKDKIKYLSVTYSVPAWIVELWVKEYPEAFEKILSSKVKRDTVIRINSTKTDFDGLEKELLKQGATLEKLEFDHAAVLKTDIDIENLEAFKNGLFHVQGLSSQICSAVLNALPKEKILDVCAAPGGKSFTMAQNSQAKAHIVAIDIYEHRTKLIEEGAKRLGLEGCIETVTADATKALGNRRYNKILCDVLCSGLGVISKKPDIIFKSKEEISALPSIQKEILSNASKHLEKDGILVYSTCTLNPAENEKLVKDFVDSNQNFEIIEISEDIVASNSCIVRGKCVTILPDNYCDGFFIAALKRTEND